MDKPKMLFIDIETSPNAAHVWGLYKQTVSLSQLMDSSRTMCLAWKWYGDKDVGFIKENAPNKNKNVIDHAWGLLEEADIIVHYNGCMVPGNRVLTENLIWKDVAELKEGDSLLAFNENIPSKNGKRKYELSKVVKAFPITKPCYTIILNNGESFTCTEDHPWLVHINNGSANWKWVETKNLEPSKHIFTKVLHTWEVEESRDFGYLAGFLDADGCISSVERPDRPGQWLLNITINQNNNDQLKEIKRLLTKYDIKYSVTNYDPNNIKCVSVRILGGFNEQLKFLGRLQATKNVPNKVLNSRSMHCLNEIGINRVIPIGDKEVIGLETTSKTYIVEGYPCHNSKFDIPTLNKEFLINSYAPPAPFKQIDLLKIARNQFKFPSNKLDYVAKALGLTGKVSHEGHELWVKCMSGDRHAWDIMEKYNKQDVVLLEEVYEVFRPWITNHPNLALWIDFIRPTCPSCGGHHMVKRGRATTTLMEYQRYQCSDCGTWTRGKTPTKRITQNEYVTTQIK